jgi:hypothetical protein
LTSVGFAPPVTAPRLRTCSGVFFCLQANLHRKLVETSEKPDIIKPSTYRLQDGGLSVFFAAVIPLYEKAKRIGIIKVKDELLTYPEIKSMMRAEKKESLPHTE